MSMQQSEAHQDRMCEVAADKLPPPSSSAVNYAAREHARDLRRSLAAARRREEVAEAAALGVAVVKKLTLNNNWTDEEDAVLYALYPHYEQIMSKIPHRSRPAMRTRVKFLGIAPARKFWTAKEISILQRLWVGATIGDLLAALPRWDFPNISHKARYIGLPLRGQQPLVLTGDTLCDEIRDRCRILGYNMSYLDRIAQSGAYFQGRKWHGNGGHRLTPMIRAVRALGGELKVEWPD